MKEQLQETGVKMALKLLRTNPDKAMSTLLSIADKVAGNSFEGQRKAIHDVLDGEIPSGRLLINRLLKDVDADIIDTVVTNFFINANLKGWPQQNDMREKHGCNIPWAILLDPTSACNLHCTGCWAADYGNKLNLSFDDIDSIIQQGKELGCYMYIYTGGEPLVRKNDIIRLCEKHNDCIFLCFTNATLIDEAFCVDLLRVRNFVPAISIEGDRESTDARRGKGTYDRVVNAMSLLKKNRLPFGISCCYTSLNIDEVSSEEYFDQMIEWGALFVWYFHYMPVGSDANTQLMCSPDQRKQVYHRVREFRFTKPIFGMDFQNDGQYVQGCIAGGRRYLHINAAGDVDPCVFVHFSDSNIHENTLLECLKSPLFIAYHDGQPFNDNMLRPCPMLENPDKLRSMIASTGAKSSNLDGKETVEELCSRCDEYANAWAPVAKDLWLLDHHVAPFAR